MSATQTRRERDLDRPARDQERRTLVVAIALTVAMFGWQGYHFYWAQRTASHERTTTLVEALHTAGEEQLGLVDHLEHDVLMSGRRISDADVTAWADRYAAASAATHEASAAALADAGEHFEEPVRLIDATRSELDQEVGDVLERLSSGPNGRIGDALLDPDHLAAQTAFGRAVDGLIAGLAAELEEVTAAERSNELHAVIVSLVLFTAAIGAWAFFVRRLRRGRRRLAAEHEHRLEVETQLSQLQKMEALGLMADGVAHDVKNLTFIISGSADEVRKVLPGGHPAAVPLTRIEDATRQADEVARALLAFSRKADPAKGALDLASVTMGMRQLLRYMLPKGVGLVVDAPQEAWVHGDAVQIQQVVFNLVANARDAMPDGGTVTIGIRPSDSPEDTGPAWILEVVDTGEGMTPDVEARLFEPFFTTRPAGSGCGLGLAIVDRIVRDHGGWIDVTTRPGEGTTFTIGLPALPASRLAEVPSRAPGVVLVGHPVPHVRDLIGGALAAEGHRTLSAGTVGEIRARLAEHPFEVGVIVIDAQLFLTLPFEGLPPDVPVVLTGVGASSLALSGRSNVTVLDEPLSLAALADSVAGLIHSVDPLVAS